MNKYLIESCIGFIHKHRRDVIESVNINDAIMLAIGGIKAAYPTEEIIEIEAKKLWCPCPYCFTEQVDFYGCPNINCPQRKK